MEDSHTVILSMQKHVDCAFFGVFDGHNGQKASKWCADHIAVGIDELTEFTTENIQKKMIQLDQLYFETTQDENNGSTAVFVILQKIEGSPNKKVIVANLGDSRCIIGHYDSTNFTCLTTDHKPDNEEEKARILAAGGFVARGRVDACLGVARAVGDHGYKNNKDIPPEKQKIVPIPEVSEAILSPNDFLLLCCDGLFESFSNQKVINLINTHLGQTQDTSLALSKILCHVLRHSRDNMTAILVELKDGTDYNTGGEFLAGEWYPGGNLAYSLAFKENCEKHGKTLTEVQELWEVRKVILKNEEEKKKRGR